jgi:porin
MSRHKSHELLTKRNLLLALVAVLTTTTSRAQDQQWLLGDWNGKRQALTEEGFEFDFVLTVEGVQNVAGGIARSSRGLANLDLIMDAQGKALGLSENGDLHLYLLGNCGGAPTDMIGDIQTTSNIEAPNTIKVYEAWWRQRHAEDSIAWLVGLHDYNALFDSLEAASHFTNSSFGISPDISQVPPSIFPTTSLAFVVSLFSYDGSYLNMGAYDGTPGDPGDPKGTHIILDDDDGIFYALEGGIENDETNSKLALGTWCRTTNYETEFSGKTYNDNSGLYLIGQTDLTDHWAGFFQLGNADKDRNQIGFYTGAGLVYSALLMEDDLFGIGLAYARNSNEYIDLNPGAEDYEMAIECTYKFCPSPWLTLQPDLQLIKNPGMNPNLDDTMTFSLRAYIRF